MRDTAIEAENLVGNLHAAARVERHEFAVHVEIQRPARQFPIHVPGGRRRNAARLVANPVKLDLVAKPQLRVGRHPHRGLRQGIERIERSLSGLQHLRCRQRWRPPHDPDQPDQRSARRPTGLVDPIADLDATARVSFEERPGNEHLDLFPDQTCVEWLAFVVSDAVLSPPAHPHRLTGRMPGHGATTTVMWS